MSLSGNPFDLSRSDEYPIYITIGSLNTKRIITLKPYIESFTLDIEKNKEEFKANDYIAYRDILEKGSVITCSLSLILPAGNLEEATNNVAKIVDLQRMINAQTNEISTLLVHFCNLINSGLPAGDRVMTAPPSNFDNLKEIGVACVCSEVSYNPDLEQGMLRAASGKLVPKVIKLELKLNYLFQDVTDSGGKVIGKFNFLNSYTSNGLMILNDRPLFPFGLFYASPEDSFLDYGTTPFSSQVNGLLSDFKNLKGKSNSWIFIGNNIKNEDEIDLTPFDESYEILESTGSTLQNKANILNSVYEESSSFKSQRYVYFDAFIKSFSRKVKSEVQEPNNATADQPFQTLYTKTQTDGVQFDLEFDSPAYNVEDAMINLGKIQTLIRLFATRAKLDPSGVEVNGAEYSYKFIQVSTNQSYCYVCVPSFIQSANSGPLTWDQSQEPAYSYENSLKVHIISLSITIDAAAGFFYIKEDNYLIPKNFNIKIVLMPSAKQLLSNYKFTQDQDGNKTYEVADEGFGINDVAGGGETEETEDTTEASYTLPPPYQSQTEDVQLDKNPLAPKATTVDPETPAPGSLGPATKINNNIFH